MITKSTIGRGVSFAAGLALAYGCAVAFVNEGAVTKRILKDNPGLPRLMELDHKLHSLTEENIGRTALKRFLTDKEFAMQYTKTFTEYTSLNSMYGSAREKLRWSNLREGLEGIGFTLGALLTIASTQRRK